MIGQYTVTFDANGGTLTGGNTVATVDGKLTSLPAATRTGNTGATAAYTFDGWFDTETGGTQVTTDTVFTRDTTIYAHWTITSGRDWSYDTAADTLIFTGDTIEDYLDSSRRPWVSHTQTVKNVVIGDGIGSIGDYAFDNCTNLSSASVPSSVKIIGNNAFRNCSSLTSMTIPSDVNQIVPNAFTGCTQPITFTYSGTAEQWDALMSGVTSGVSSGVTAYSGWTVQGTGWGGSYDGSSWTYEA